MKSILTFSCFLLLTAYVSAEVRHPNVVLIFADDMGYGDVTCYDAESKIHTPNLDQLAKGGMRFTDAHSASAVCTPSRYALLTGRYAWRTGLKSGVLGGFSQPLIEKGRMTVADLFQGKGYRTACIGKWHLGMDWGGGMRGEKGYTMRNNSEGIDFTKPIQNTAIVNGFSEYFGIAASLDMPPYVFIRNDRVTEQPTSSLKEEDKGGRQGPAVPGWRHKHVMPTLTDEVISFIQRNEQSPFFVYMPLNAPHTPHAPGDAFVGTSKLDIYGDFMVEVDHHIGRVMNTLDRLKLTDNTLVIVTSDNGPETNMYPRRSKYGHDSSSHFLGAKRDNWEGGHRVPFIARWPGVIAPGSTCDTPFCLVDMMATFAEMMSVELPTDQGVDSVSILPLMLGKGDDYRKAHAIIHHSSSGRFAIRNGDWKLLLHAGSGGNGYGAGQRSSRYNGTIEQRSFDTANRQLYNIRTDPDETTNLIEIRPDVVSELTALASEYVRQGRSTPGPHLKTDLQNWPQIDWLSPHAMPTASGNTSDENEATSKPKTQ
jgi:arylsulfatase A-like enzyme